MGNNAESMETEQILNVFFGKMVSLFDLVPSSSKGSCQYQWLQSVKGVAESAFVRESKQGPEEFPWP